MRAATAMGGVGAQRPKRRRDCGTARCGAGTRHRCHTVERRRTGGTHGIGRSLRRRGGVALCPAASTATARADREAGHLGTKRAERGLPLRPAVRALAFEIADTTVLLISGTASVDENGETVHVGDFRAQCWRTYRNITTLLESADMTWHDIVRTTCYLRDIERDYKDFNEVRTAFFGWVGFEPLPASTGIQARLCREDLLIEIEAIAVARRG